MRRLNIYLWGMLSFLVVLAVAVIAMPAAGAFRPVTICGALTLSAGVAAFFVARAFRAVRGEPGLRTTWVLLSLGVLAWFVSGVLNFHYVISGSVSVTYPTYADLLWGVGAGFIIAALVIKIKRRPARVSPQAMAGALAAAAVAFIVVVNFVIVPALRNPALTPRECFADCFIVAADFALGALALVIIAIHGGQGMGRPWVQVAVGLIFYAIGDAIHWHLMEAGQYGRSTSLVTALFWTAGYLLIGLGAYYRRLVLKGVVTFPPAETGTGSQAG